MVKSRRNEPNHEPGHRRGGRPGDCTRCEGAGSTRTVRMERDQDGVFSGAEVVTCSNCGGTGKEAR